VNQPLISLLILGYKNFDQTTRVCLESLLPWVSDPQLEFIALDNGSPDDSPQKAVAWCAQHPQVRCVLSEVNRGFAGGMNWGAAQARGQWLFLVNNDTVFAPAALDALKRVVQQAPPKVAMLGPVTNAAGNGQRLWQPQADHAQWLQTGAWINQHPTHQLMPAYRCDFFCVAIRRDVWQQLKGLDEAFGLGYYEDFDFSLRLSQAGYEQKITEDVFILHLGSATFKGNASARALLKKNKKLLQSKHPQARFEHTRLGNLAVLEHYQQIEQAGQWNPTLAQRLGLRAAALTGDAPRSWLKRLLWSRRVAALRSWCLDRAAP
jgi:GT2 family glycosyltransferase